MKKIFISLVILSTLFAFSSCFDDGLNEFRIQFVNKGVTDFKNVKFYDDKQLFASFKGTSKVKEESEFRSSPTMTVDELTRVSTDIYYNFVNIPVILKLKKSLGILSPHKSYAVELDSEFCFKLYEREDIEVSFQDDTGKTQVGSKSCIDINELPDIGLF